VDRGWIFPRVSQRRIENGDINGMFHILPIYKLLHCRMSSIFFMVEILRMNLRDRCVGLKKASLISARG